MTSIETLNFFADKTIHDITTMVPREYGNEAYRITTEDQIYVVRRLKRGETDAQVEYRAGRLAHAAGIAPEIFLYDADRALMVLEFIPGEHRTQLNDAEIAHLARILRRLHMISYRDEDLPKIDLRHLIEPDRSEIIEAFAIVEHFLPQLALCHHDLTPRNILWTHEEPTLIDFEFAGIGDVCFDLAAVCVEFQLDREACGVFLSEYFGTASCPEEKRSAWETLYRALRRQWFARHGINSVDQIP